ncbi:YadA C-terminal domain-containing protein [Vibrio sp. Isolate30]|uniref:YadA C-terminal domain-containing protein n=1 Tax=Vibrio sp. Isolate30 TaxID=2908536 RepID=UPI001EFDBDD0|nr:YadA C-terminal domain-containing protein [Vibrio sp. Isolate30]MCG9632687.1 YadA-like family protein [Vibrio sp. Isolate30]
MKKSIIAVSLASAFSFNAFAEAEVQNPIWNQPTNPIEAVPEQPVLPGIDNSVPGVPDRPQPPVHVQPPIEAAPEQPVLPEVDNGVPGIPDRPQPQRPTNPIQGTPSNPVEIQPEHPIQDGDYAPDISGPTESERTSALELGFQAMAEEYNQKFNEHQEQMDGIRASLHAVTNARPFVTNGEFAVGAGVGFAGSKEAIALGGAYGISEQLSVSGTFNYETSGKYSSSDVSGGVGVQFNFK